MSTKCNFLHVHLLLFFLILHFLVNEMFCQLKLDSHFNQSKTNKLIKYENFNLKNVFVRKSMNKNCKNENWLS